MKYKYGQRRKYGDAGLFVHPVLDKGGNRIGWAHAVKGRGVAFKRPFRSWVLMALPKKGSPFELATDKFGRESWAGTKDAIELLQKVGPILASSAGWKRYEDITLAMLPGFSPSHEDQLYNGYVHVIEED